MRTMFCMSSSAAHRLDCYGQVEVDFFKTGLPAPYHRGESARSGLSMPDERPNGGRTLGADGYANHIGGAKKGTPATRPLERARLGELRRHQRDSAQSPSVFASNVGRRYPAPGFSRLVERAATARAATSSPTMVTHARDPSVSRPSQQSKYDALYRPSAPTVQGIFSGLIKGERIWLWQETRAAASHLST